MAAGVRKGGLTAGTNQPLKKAVMMVMMNATEDEEEEAGVRSPSRRV